MKFLVRIVIVVMVGVVSVVLLLVHFLCTRQQAFNTYVSQLRSQGEKLTFQELISAYPRHTNHSFLRLSNVVASLGPFPGDIGNQHIAQLIDGGDPTPLKTSTTNSIVDRRDIVWPLTLDRGQGI